MAWRCEIESHGHYEEEHPKLVAEVARLRAALEAARYNTQMLWHRHHDPDVRARSVAIIGHCDRALGVGPALAAPDGEGEG